MPSLHATFRWALLLSICLIGLQGCVATVATRMADAAMGAAMESVGIAPPDPNAARPLSVTLAAGELLNATDDGESLALVIKLYQLRNDAGFATLSYAQTTNPGQEKNVLAQDLVAVREITLIPGKTYEFEEKVPAEVKVVGVVAQFRAPAANRWKLAFNRDASEETGIAVGFHACAMTVGKGELVGSSATQANRILGGVRCN